ncbi:molybdopterin molybdenumtransferase MoeA [Helicobacter apodemus]|uniref:Molybdopterin molybdenumtransferase n=1 Tax=Helicobacter apodemus TaxID=135569 RepID=A0A4U8UG02_9HELI|nr:molybdopterin molybdotransferase MoeA [Helicobacter apodemus]MDE6958121.1 molybdopterin molybdotransferase MoeA [Helicobacter apodemus]TLE15788.1 molybdopterin molybdenumtransferase MoeA [Helicobacter apodemus]
MEEKITYARAKEILQNQKISPKGLERVFLYESLGRVLAKDIFASEDMPEVALSNMDGYALSSTMIELSKGIFTILGENPAGNEKKVELPLTQPYAIKTLTGAAIPHNADILVPFENVNIKGETLEINAFPKIGEFIRNIGDNYKKGEKLLSQGVRLNANHIGLLASLNHIFVEVFEKPKVGILVSGNEILEIGESKNNPHCFYNANGHLLYAKVKENGGMPKLYPILKDEKFSIQSCLKDALEECDLVISTGGASVGDYDFIQAISKEWSEKIVFRGVRIKPGQHIIYAHFHKKQFFGLPGFPNSTLVTFELFVKAILTKLCGMPFKEEIVEVTLQEDLQKGDKRLEFRVCNIRHTRGKISIDFEGKKSFQSAILNNFCPLDNARVGLAILEGNKLKGERIPIILLNC